MKDMVGYPWRPVPTVEGDHIPININDDGEIIERSQEDTNIGADMPESKDENNSG